MGQHLSFRDVWPLSGLRVTSGDLELRYADDALLWQLAALAADGIHPPERMPFSAPWTRGTPEQVARNAIQYHWGVRSRLTPQDFSIDLAVVRQLPDGEQVVGMQGFVAKDFSVTRSAETGSWLGKEFQGQGIGTRMRFMILALLFDGLGATVATTAAFADNAASNAVTRRIGYESNGIEMVNREGAMAKSLRYRLMRQEWESLSARPGVQIVGIGPVREFLGIPAEWSTEHVG